MNSEVTHIACEFSPFHSFKFKAVVLVDVLDKAQNQGLEEPLLQDKSALLSPNSGATC